MAGTIRGGRLFRIGGSAQRQSKLSAGCRWKRAKKVLRLYQENYYDLNMRHFHEKLGEMHGIELSYTWVQQALQGAGLVAKRRKQRGPHRRRRERRPLPGMLLHIDGSKHRWFSDDRYYDLIVILDDATSEIYYAQLVEEESTRTVMAGLREVIERKGLFCALYSDRGSHFFVTPKAGEKVDKQSPDASGPGDERAGGADDSRPTRRRREDVASGTSGPGKDVCRRSCGWPGSPRWRKPIRFCGNAISRSSIRSLRVRGNRERNRLPTIGPLGSGLGIHEFRPNAWWPRTTRSLFGISVGKSKKPDGATVWPDAPSPFTSIWTAESRCATDRMWWRASAAREDTAGKLSQAPWKRREPGSRRKPKAGFLRLPSSLGNLAQTARFPLSHRADDYDAHSKERKNQGSLTGQLVCE